MLVNLSIVRTVEFNFFHLLRDSTEVKVEIVQNDYHCPEEKGKV